MGQFLQALPPEVSPIVAFTLLLLVSLILPPIFERLRLPGLVGLIVAGILLGQSGLGLLDPETETIELLSDIGKVYLMFVAGLEIDLAEFRKTRDRSLGFGLSTFLVPMIMGTLVGLYFDFGWNAAILIGSLMASHTLLAYPIVQRLGVVRNEAVTVTIGATILTDIAALLVLAICVSIDSGEFSLNSLLIQLGSLAIYTVAVLFGIRWVGRDYFQRTGDEESNQFLFVLLAVFLASVGAQAINIDKIIGAFLAGLAINDVIGRGPVQEKIEFVGSTLFIPFFFVDTGLLLNIPAFVDTLIRSFGLTFAIVGGLISSKFLAAFTVKWIYRYSWIETLTMWSLSLPQVAATLAAALVGYETGIITQSVFNSVIVLMLVKSLAGPLMTERFAVKLPAPKVELPQELEQWWGSDGLDLEQEPGLEEQGVQLGQSGLGSESPFTVVVPVANPLTENNLIELAALIARHESGVVVPLSIAKANLHLDDPDLARMLRRGRQLLNRAIEVTERTGAIAHPYLRVDDDIANAISRTAREQEARLIVMGWSDVGLRSRFFGTVTDSVFWAAHCPVAVARLLDEPMRLKRILVPVKNMQPQSLWTLQFAQLLAETNDSALTLLHVCDRRTPAAQTETLMADLSQWLSHSPFPRPTDIQVVVHDDPATAILQASQAHDLVILRSIRRRTVGGLAVSDVTTQVIQSIACSVVLFGEPYSSSYSS